MKFINTDDKKLFLIEIEKVNLLDSVNEQWEPSAELMELFHDRREKLVPSFKDFRRSQSSKKAWRQNRYSMLKGVRQFHKSTAGKRMHRTLGDYLATHITKNDYSLTGEAKYEALKSLSSLRTHLYIEAPYYRPIDEQIEFDNFLDEVLYASLREENRIFENKKESDEKDIDILCRAVELKPLLQSICVIKKKEFADNMIGQFESMVSEGQSYTETLSKFSEEL